MVSYPVEFKTALAEQIRPEGCCQIKFVVNGTAHDIDSLYVQSVYIDLTGDPISRRLPTEAAEIQLLDYEKNFHPDKPDGVANRASSGYWWNSSVEVQIRFGMVINGTAYYGDFVKFISEKPPNWRGSMATFECVRKLETMRGEFRTFPGRLRSMAELATTIIQAADWQAQYSIDSTYLSNFPVEDQNLLIGYTYNDAMLTLAAAHGLGIRTNSSGVIEIKDYYTVAYDPSTAINLTDVILSADDMIEEPVASKLPAVRNEVISYPGPADEGAQETTLLEYSKTFDSTDQVALWIELQTPGMPETYHTTITGDDGLSGITEYRGYVFVQFNPRSTTEPVTITVTGVPIKFDTMTAELPHTDSEGQIVSGTDDDEFKNPLITDYSLRTVASKRARYLYETMDAYSIRYRGDPRIEPYDIIRVELPFVGIVPCIVLETQFNYNGAFSGNLVVRKIDAEDITMYASNTAVAGLAVAGYAICGWTDE